MAQRYTDVTVTGAVDDIRPYLERADVFVAPLRFASGTQNKMLEAMSLEVPVVTTRVVAAGLCGIATGHRQKMPRKLAAGVAGLFTHAEERARLSKESRRFVEAHCSSPAVRKNLKSYA